MRRIIYPNLANELKDKNISFREMAETIGVSEKSFYRRMIGETDWKLHEVARVCTILGAEYPIQLYLRLDVNI